MNSTTDSIPEMPYIRLRAALELFGKPPFELEPEELRKAVTQAQREYGIETRILKTPEAAGVVVTDEEIERAVAEIRERYQDEAAFAHSLIANDLDEITLRTALARQCKVNTVLDLVAAAADRNPINETDVGIYYHTHFANFQQPERREAFHILISINDSFPENTRPRAIERLQTIAERLKQKPRLFEELAMRHSECPTAMRGGRIGLVRRGQLFGAVDEALFKLKTGDLSEIVESEVGFHLVLCKTIQPPETISLKKASPHIRKVLRDRMREQCRRNWIAGLAP